MQHTNNIPQKKNHFYYLLMSFITLLIFCFVSPNSYAFYGVDYGKYYHDGNLWHVLSQNFSLDDECNNPAVYRQIHWFLANRSFLRGVANNAKPYLYFIYRRVKTRGLPAELALLPIIESAYNPFAYSKQGAAGLWQLMPGTASSFGIKQSWWYDGRRDIYASTRVALDLLSNLDHSFHGHWLLALASYDSGEGVIDGAISYNYRHHKPTDFWDLPLSDETENYVPRLLALACIIKHHDYYNVHLPPIANKPFLARVNVGNQIDLAKAAKLAHISLKELVFLNPGYNHWATAPNGPDYLVIPRNKLATFKANLARLPKRDRVTWHRYHVRRGDTLDGIAARFHTAVKIIKQVNHLHHSLLHVGQILLIPLHTHKLKQILYAAESPYFNRYNQLPKRQKITHRVLTHENLYTIATEYHVSVGDIRYWNHLHSNVIYPGEKLIIWRPVSYREHRYYTYYKRLYYQVQPGDSLWRIAHRYHVSVNDLLRWNHLAKHAVLHAKQNLVLYIKK